MVDQIMHVDWLNGLFLVAAVAGIVIGAERLVASAASIKERFVDRRRDKLLDAALDGDETLRAEVFKMLDDAHKEHERYEEMFRRDKRRIDVIEDAIDEIRSDVDKLSQKADAREQEGIITMKAIKTMMNRFIGLAEDSDIIDVVNEVDQYLIERNGKWE